MQWHHAVDVTCGFRDLVVTALQMDPVVNEAQQLAVQGPRYFEAERLIRHGVTLAAVQFVHDQSLEVTGEILSVKSSFFRLNHFEPVS